MTKDVLAAQKMPMLVKMSRSSTPWLCQDTRPAKHSKRSGHIFWGGLINTNPHLRYVKGFGKESVANVDQRTDKDLA